MVAGDFNLSNIRTVLPKSHQNISCFTRGNSTLDHLCTNIAEAYKALLSDHFLFMPSTCHLSGEGMARVSNFLVTTAVPTR